MTNRRAEHDHHDAGSGEASVRVHLARGGPWRQAVAELTGDERADTSDLRWEFPDDIREGDTVLTLVDVPGAVIIELGVAYHAPGGYEIDVEALTSFPTGVAIAAVEHRLGATLPAAPATIGDEALARRILRSVEAEAESPTSWRHPAFASDPAAERCGHHDRQIRPSAEFFGCAVCERTDTELETHLLADQEDLEFAEADQAHVCAPCHDRLHTALPPLLAELICADRPLCPSCSMARTRQFLVGMIPGPPPPGRIATGCVIFSPADDEYECASCGFSWSEQDWHFAYATEADHGQRVRARLANIPPHPEAEYPELWWPGRLVVGRTDSFGPPAGIESAWGGSEHGVMLGDDRRIYTVDPRTIRRLELPSLTVDHMGSHYVTSRAGDALFPRLRDPGGDVTLCSPYLTKGIAEQLADLAAESDVDWYLMTSLDARAAAHSFLSADGLDALLDAGVAIRDCRGLHAKAYVVGESFAMVGSANLTSSGLGWGDGVDQIKYPNSELSVIVPQPEVAVVQHMLDTWWDEGWDVDADDVQLLRERAERFEVEPTGGTPSEQTVAELLRDSRQSDVTLWVKAQSGPAVPEVWKHRSWFSSPSPAARPTIKPGDLVVIYSRGDRGCYAIVEVLDDPEFNPDHVAAWEGEERGRQWPWVNRTIPRLVPEIPTLVPPSTLGKTHQALQGWATKLSVEEFENAVRAISRA